MNLRLYLRLHVTVCSLPVWTSHLLLFPFFMIDECLDMVEYMTVWSQQRKS